LGGAYCFVIAVGFYFGPNYLVDTPRLPALAGHGGIFARDHYTYTPSHFFA